MIRDGDAVSVASEIAQSLFRTSERRLRVDNPVLPKQRSQESREVPQLSHVLKLSGETQTFLAEAFRKPATNLPRKTFPRAFTGKKNERRG